MKKPVLFLLLLLCVVEVASAKKDFFLSGRVKESFGKTDLIKAYVLTYDSLGNVRDSIRTNQGLTWRNNGIDTLSVFNIPVPRVDSTYIFDVVCEGYKPQTVSYTVENIGKRENWRNIGVIYLERAPVMLKEVTVTTSKIKFYNDGDTLVYNADAFSLAEGSMLDALIAQLPGVELNTNGQIKVNGEFVESLLLNGKQFFDGNNNLMLENIAAYTVKDVKVYEAAKKEDILTGNENNKVLTMNVRLKKEYNIGWLVNAQGGYGTDNRYLGKVFASWFNPTTNIAFIGNVNNLNSNRMPGRNDTWTPEELPKGTKTYVSGGFTYNYEHPENKRMAEGNIFFGQDIDNTLSTTARINFLSSGDTYENSYGKSHNRTMHLATRHFFNIELRKDLRVGFNVNGGYDYSKFNSANLAGTFSKDPGEMNSEILDAIYSSGSEELLGTILNRAKTQSDSRTKSYNLSIRPNLSFQLPHSNDVLILSLSAAYSAEKSELWRDYEINFGADVNDRDNRSQYTDNSPNHDLNLGASLRYSTSSDHFYGSISYDYNFEEQTKDSYLYTIERLNDLGIYGVLPSEYFMSFDAQNSYTSRLFQNSHSINPNLRWNVETKKNTRIIITFMPRIELLHRKFDYWSNYQNYRLSKTYGKVDIGGYMGAMFQYDFNKKEENGRVKYRNSLRYSYSITPTLPDMFDMIDADSDSDPLNIYVGNPDLKMAWRHRHLFRWQYLPHSHPTFNNILYVSFTHASGSLTRGYNYDTTTGVRINKMYNVDGNRTWALTNELSWQFGATKQFTFTSTTDGILATYNDMIGIDMAQPRKVCVRNNTLTENIKMAWQIGKQNIALRCDFTARNTTSEQPDFSTINAMHVNYGVSGNFILPAGFSISTDFMCYTRRGYGSANLDTTDPVWNARVSYAPVKNKHWVFMLDGFDILHQLSNVNYAVTATGRTVSYTNVIPRYVMLSVQYRLNLQPKK